MRLSDTKVKSMDLALLKGLLNLRLRNRFHSLEALCLNYDLDEQALLHRLRSANCHYDLISRQFL